MDFLNLQIYIEYIFNELLEILKKNHFNYNLINISFIWNAIKLFFINVIL